VDREGPEADERAGARAVTASEHGETDAELWRRSARVDHVVSDLGPGVALQMLALADHDGRRAGVELVQPREDRPALAGVLGGGVGPPGRSPCGRGTTCGWSGRDWARWAPRHPQSS